MGGLIYIFLQTIRSQPASVAKWFIGFRKSSRSSFSAT